MNETYTGFLFRTFPELGPRERLSLACENQWHERPNKWREENRRAAITHIRILAEDAMTPEAYR